MMRRVLVGFAGCVNGGRHDRSRLRWEPREDARERAGEPPGDGEATGCRLGEAAGESWRGDPIVFLFCFFVFWWLRRGETGCCLVALVGVLRRGGYCAC